MLILNAKLRNSRDFSNTTIFKNFGAFQYFFLPSATCDEITTHYRNNTFDLLTLTRAGVAIEYHCGLGREFIDPDDTVARWYDGVGGAVGTPDQIVDRLAAHRDAGMGYAIGYFPDAAYSTESMELFADTVMPALND